jgi:hypothetical protein
MISSKMVGLARWHDRAIVAEPRPLEQLGRDAHLALDGYGFVQVDITETGVYHHLWVVLVTVLVDRRLNELFGGMSAYFASRATRTRVGGASPARTAATRSGGSESGLLPFIVAFGTDKTLRTEGSLRP